MRASALRLGLLLLLLLLSAAGTARAMESAPVASRRSVATLVSDADSVGPDGRIRLALRLRQAPGWHTYWRNPGDAGLPAELEFDLPPGATAAPIGWPTPRRIAEGGLTSFAYVGEVLLPVSVSVPKGAALAVRLQARWLICEAICVPEEGRFTLDIPAGIGAASPQAALFDAASTPRPSPWPATLDPQGILHLQGADLGPDTVSGAWFAADAPGRVEAATAQAPARIAPGSVSLELRPGGPPGPLSGIVVLRDPAGREDAVTVTALPGPAPVAAVAAPAAAASPVGWAVLGAALLGGMLLNVMPCVFPVLAMKAAGLAGLGGAARGRARYLAGFYLLGCVATFGALGGALLLLRRFGELAGWGFQFQDPAFVAAIALLLFVMGLNFAGVFAIGSGRLEGAGQSLTNRGGRFGSFATGALAVLVATPCTAPFMGAAVAAALAAPWAVALGVFGCLGLGLALPYVAVAWLPGVSRLLPRPGGWMERLRQALAFPLFLTVAWLAWVLVQQTGPDGVLRLGVGCVALGFGAWLVGIAQRGPRRRMLLLGCAGLVAAAAFASVALLRPAPAAAVGTADAFSPARLAALRAANRPVFVDMTAAWCVSCLVNERVALRPEAVRAAFAARGVVLLRGDWTRRDAAITRFLREHGSDGVPLYVFYPAGGGAPVVLPQILTPGLVLRTIA